MIACILDAIFPSPIRRNDSVVIFFSDSTVLKCAIKWFHILLFNSYLCVNKERGGIGRKSNTLLKHTFGSLEMEKQL